MAQIGLKHIHVAKLTEENGVISYDTPRKIAHAITANITPNSEQVTLYGDDMAVESDEALADIDVEIGVTDLSAADYAYLLGGKVDSQGGVTDTVNNVSPYVALGFEVTMSGGGKRMYWYYKGKFQIPTSEHTTKQGSIEYQTPTVAAKFIPRTDGKWRYRLDSIPANKATVDAWYTAVQEEPSEDTYSIAPISDQTLTPLTVGYANGTQQEKTITITNTGNMDLENVAVTLGGTDATDFAKTNPATTIAVGANSTFTVKANNGLTADTYNATVTVAATNLTPVTFNVTQVVGE